MQRESPEASSNTSSTTSHEGLPQNADNFLISFALVLLARLDLVKPFLGRDSLTTKT